MKHEYIDPGEFVYRKNAQQIEDPASPFFYC